MSSGAIVAAGHETERQNNNAVWSYFLWRLCWVGHEECLGDIMVDIFGLLWGEDVVGHPGFRDV